MKEPTKKDLENASYIVYVKQAGSGKEKPYPFRMKWAAQAFARDTGGRMQEKT